MPCCLRINVLLSSCLLQPSCRQNVAYSSKHDPICAMSVGSVKVLCVCFFKPRESKIPSVPCRFSVFLPSCLLHASRGQAWRPRARTNQSFPCRFSRSVVCVSLNPRASTNSSMPFRFNVLLPSCLLHASRGQAWRPRARSKQSLPCRFSQSLVCVFQTMQSLPSRFSQSLVCVFLSLEQHDPISAMWARRVLPSCFLHESRGQTWSPRASTNQSLPCRFSQSLL